MKKSRKEIFAISEALQLIIKLLTVNEKDVPLKVQARYRKAKIKYVNSTLKLLERIEDGNKKIEEEIKKQNLGSVNFTTQLNQHTNNYVLK